MKKKIYFIISSILQVLGNLYIAIFANDIIQSQIDVMKEVYTMFPVDFQERVLGLMQNNGTSFYIFMSCIGIILNLIILKTAIQNNILRKKGLLIAFSVICFCTSLNTISMIFSIVNFIVLLCLKREKPEDYPVKKEIPNIEYQKSSKKQIILSIIFMLLYFSQFVIDKYIPENISKVGSIILTVSIYVILFLSAIFVFKDKLKNDIKLFKENSRAYSQFIFPRLGIFYISFLFINMICIFITKKATSENQVLLEQMPKWFVIPAAILWAPVVEELVFRGVLRRFIKNNILFIIISAIAFGLLHTIHESTILNVIVLAIPYASFGSFLAYMYSKTENICTNIFSHCFLNTIGMILMNLFLFII